MRPKRPEIDVPLDLVLGLNISVWRVSEMLECKQCAHLTFDCLTFSSMQAAR